jgi:hypothetical protein
MDHNPVFRITEDDFGRLREHTSDQSLIDAYARWLNRDDELDSLIRSIENAFANFPLGEGTGLLEANGLDDYADKDQLAELRLRDEHTDWRRIDVNTLERCYAAPIFMNARGFVFHIPAFVIAELNDKIQTDFIDRLFEIDRQPDNWTALLDDSQREAITAVLSMIIEHPDYREYANAITIAISRLNEAA